MSTGDLLDTLLNQLGLNNSSAANASKNKEVKPSQFPAPITNPNLVAYQVFGPIGPSYFAPPAPMYGHAPTYIQAQAGVPLGQATILPHAFTVGSLHDLTTGAWNMDTGVSSHLNDSVTNLSEVFNSCMYPSISVGDGHSIPVTNTAIVFCQLPLDLFTKIMSLSLRCDSTGDLYPVTHSYPIPHAFLVSQHTWHKRLGHPEGDVLRRLRSLYGLKQAPRAWFQRFASYITRVGFHSSRCDSSLFIYKHGPDTAYLLLYVDDIVLTASSQPLLQRIIASLHQEFSMTDLGSLNYFLGISVTRDSSGLFLSQKKYAIEILEKAHMVSCNPSRTPVDTESKLGVDGDPVSDPTLYRSLEALSISHFYRQSILMAFQQGTLIMIAVISLSTTYLVELFCCGLGGCHDSVDRLQGIVCFLATILLSWSETLSATLSRSSAKAEYRGVANVIAETCWLRNLLRELHTPLSSATLVYCDNASAVYLSSNPVQHQCTKHIEIDIHFVHDLVAAGQVRVLHVPSCYQFADIFTKGLPLALFEEFRTSLSVWCPPALTAGEFTMADQRTMAELLQAPTEGYGDAIVIPAILAENSELKHGLLNLITSTIKYRDVPNSSIKFMLFPFSIEGTAQIWLEKEPPRSILTWEDLVSMFINQFFPPSKTTNLRNEITNFQQRFEETFSEAWDHFKDLLCACPHHGFTKLHQLDTFYNALTPTDQDSLNAAAGCNLLTKTPRDALTIIENKSKVCNSWNKPVVTKVSMNAPSSSTPHFLEIAALADAVKAMLLQNSSPPASVKAVDVLCVTCGGLHPYLQWQRFFRILR
ncbi:ribonuclease H-like domain-containing protein [Tanacetum coccineum]